MHQSTIHEQEELIECRQTNSGNLQETLKKDAAVAHIKTLKLTCKVCAESFTDFKRLAAHYKVSHLPDNLTDKSQSTAGSGEQNKTVRLSETNGRGSQSLVISKDPFKEEKQSLVILKDPFKEEKQSLVISKDSFKEEISGDSVALGNDNNHPDLLRQGDDGRTSRKKKKERTKRVEEMNNLRLHLPGRPQRPKHSNRPHQNDQSQPAAPQPDQSLLLQKELERRDQSNSQLQQHQNYPQLYQEEGPLKPDHIQTRPQQQQRGHRPHQVIHQKREHNEKGSSSVSEKFQEVWDDNVMQISAPEIQSRTHQLPSRLTDPDYGKVVTTPYDPTPAEMLTVRSRGMDGEKYLTAGGSSGCTATGKFDRTTFTNSKPGLVVEINRFAQMSNQSRPGSEKQTLKRLPTSNISRFKSLREAFLLCSAKAKQCDDGDDDVVILDNSAQ